MYLLAVQTTQPSEDWKITTWYHWRLQQMISFMEEVRNISKLWKSYEERHKGQVHLWRKTFLRKELDSEPWLQYRCGSEALRPRKHLSDRDSWPHPSDRDHKSKKETKILFLYWKRSLHNLEQVWEPLHGSLKKQDLTSREEYPCCNRAY